MPHIIAFTGRAGAGKTTAANYLRLAAEAHHATTITKVLAFADPLRAAVDAVFPHLGHETFRSRKNEPIPSMPDWSGRRILQVAGTDWFRGLDGDVWIKNMEHRIRVLDHGRSYVFIDDVRFPNEAELVRKLSGKLYRIARPGHAPLEGAAASHSSEAFVDGLAVDGEIDNTGTLEDFGRVLDTIWENRR
jgi:hypothetical protein